MPNGVKKEDAPHPVAVFMYKNPHAPCPGRKVSAPKLGPQPKVPELHGYASDDYLSNCIIGGRNPMSDGPFSRNAVKTYWLQYAAPAFQSLFRRDRSHRVWRGGPRDSGRGRR